MKLSNQQTRSTLTAVVLALSVATAPASHGFMDGSGYGPGAGGCDMQGGARHGGGQHFAKPGFVEGKLAFLKTELGITDAQQQVWERFSQSMRELDQERAQFRDSRRTQMQARGKSGPNPEQQMKPLTERIDQRLSMIERRSAHMTRMVQTVKALYVGLSPQQQTVADQIFSGRGRHGF